MSRMSEECLDFINSGRFLITDAGPLHGPVHRFLLRRDEKLTLWLETEAAADATSTAIDYPAGTVRLNTDSICLAGFGNAEAKLQGVATLSVKTARDARGEMQLKETTRVHRATMVIGDRDRATYTVEWLENLAGSPFIWPDTFRTVSSSTTTHQIGSGYLVHTRRTL